jgi:hypothetical protein
MSSTATSDARKQKITSGKKESNSRKDAELAKRARIRHSLTITAPCGHGSATTDNAYDLHRAVTAGSGENEFLRSLLESPNNARQWIWTVLSASPD